MSLELVIAFSVGFFIGYFLSFVAQKFTIKMICREAANHERDQDRRDSANWWKYGGEPFSEDEENYDE